MGMEVGSDGAILNHQQHPLPRDIGSPIMPQYNLLLVPDTDATQYKPLATKYGPQPRRNSHSGTPNIMDVREGDARQQHEEHLQNLQDQREQAMQNLVDKVKTQAQERDAMVADMQGKM